MITRAPTGLDVGLDINNKVVPALLSVTIFGLMAWASVDAFGTDLITSTGVATTNELIGESLLGRFAIPFEVVSFVLLGALIGGITIARRDLTPVEEEEKASV
jgi:NADH-quinone oxidoreductase subunit J